MAKKIDSRCLHSSSFVEFSLVIHASVSPHMHVVLHTSFCSWLTSSFVCVCLSVLFSPIPPIVFLWWQEMCVTPLEPLVDHRPTEKWNGKKGCNVCGGEGRNVTRENSLSCWYNHCLLTEFFFSARKPFFFKDTPLWCSDRSFSETATFLKIYLISYFYFINNQLSFFSPSDLLQAISSFIYIPLIHSWGWSYIFFSQFYWLIPIASVLHVVTVNC